MKKLLALLLALAMLLSLAGCVKVDVLPEDENEGIIEEEPYDEFFEEDYEEPPAEDNEYGFDVTPTIEETVLYNEKGIKITAKSLSYGFYSAKLELLFENTTAVDWSYSGSQNVAGYVNGCSYSNYIFGDIPAGSSTTENFEFDYYTLAYNGIKVIKEMGIALTLSDPDFNETDIGPFSVKTSAYDTSAYDEDAFFERVNDPAMNETFGETVLYSEKAPENIGRGIKVISRALLDLDYEKDIAVQFLNDSDKAVMVSVYDIRPNGICFPQNGYSYVLLEPHCGGVMSINLNQDIPSETANALGFYDFGTISYSVAVRDAEDEFGELEVLKNYTITLEGKPTTTEFEKTEEYNKNGIAVYSMGIYPNSWEGEAIFFFYVENNSGKGIFLSCSESTMKVNGKDVEYYNNLAFMPDGFKGITFLTATELGSVDIASYKDITSYEIGVEIGSEDTFEDIDTFVIKK